MQLLPVHRHPVVPKLAYVTAAIVAPGEPHRSESRSAAGVGDVGSRSPTPPQNGEPSGPGVEGGVEVGVDVGVEVGVGARDRKGRTVAGGGAELGWRG